MFSMLIKPGNVPVNMMMARLKVMNAYLLQFPCPVSTAISTDNMFDIILAMIPSIGLKHGHSQSETNESNHQGIIMLVVLICLTYLGTRQ